MTSSHNSEAPKLSVERDLDGCEKIIQSWGFRGHISKVTPYKNEIFFRYDGVIGICPNVFKNSELHEIVSSWGYEGVTSPIHRSEIGGMLTFMHNGSQHSCPGVLAYKYTTIVTVARILEREEALLSQ